MSLWQFSNCLILVVDKEEKVLFSTEKIQKLSFSRLCLIDINRI